MEINKELMQIEEEVKHLTDDMKDFGTELQEVKKDGQQTKKIVEQIHMAIIGNSDLAIPGIGPRITECEKRIVDVSIWRDRHADYVVNDYNITQKRLDDIEKFIDRIKVYLAVWGGVATVVAFILQIIFKHFFKT